MEEALCPGASKATRRGTTKADERSVRAGSDTKNCINKSSSRFATQSRGSERTQALVSESKQLVRTIRVINKKTSAKETVGHKEQSYKKIM